MKVVTFENYKSKLAQLRLINGLLKTAKFDTFEEFVRVENYKQHLEIELDEYERNQGGGLLHG